MGKSKKSVFSGRIAKKTTTKMGSGIHPKSRKANKIGKQLAHDKRIEQRGVERDAKDRPKIDKMLWFKAELLSDDYGLHEKRALTHSDVKLLVDSYVEHLKNEVQEVVAATKALPSKRIPNSSQIKRETRMVQSIEKELAEIEAIGIEIPDLTSAVNVQRLREWNGEAKQLPAFHFTRFKLKIEKS